MSLLESVRIGLGSGVDRVRGLVCEDGLRYATLMDWRQHIEVNPAVLVGKPVVRGTRLSVEHVLAMMAAGVTEAEILQNHPRLRHEDILACLAYAAESLSDQRVFPLSA